MFVCLRPLAKSVHNSLTHSLLLFICPPRPWNLTLVSSATTPMATVSATSVSFGASLKPCFNNNRVYLLSYAHLHIKLLMCISQICSLVEVFYCLWFLFPKDIQNFFPFYCVEWIDVKQTCLNLRYRFKTYLVHV